MTDGALARAGLTVTAAFLVSRVLGWVRVVVLGNLFGPGAELDAYYAAFRIPDLMFQLVAAGAIGSSLIPVLTGLIAAGERSRAERVASSVANLVLGALLVLSVLMAVFAPVIVPWLVPGFDAETTAMTVELTRLMLIAPIFLAAGAIASAVLNTDGRFGAAALAPVAYNVAIIGGAILLGPALGVFGAAVGVVVGAVAHLLVQVPALRGRFRYRGVVDTGDAATRESFALMLPRAIGMGANQITFLVNTALATTVAVGAVVSYNVAFSVVQIPLGVIGLPLGVVLLPTLSRALADGRADDFARILGRSLRLLLWTSLYVTAVGIVMREPVIDALFGWGFDEAALAATATTLGVFLLGLPAHALNVMLARAFYSGRDTATPVAVGGRVGRGQRRRVAPDRGAPRALRPRARDRGRSLVRGDRPDAACSCGVASRSTSAACSAPSGAALVGWAARGRGRARHARRVRRGGAGRPGRGGRRRRRAPGRRGRLDLVRRLPRLQSARAPGRARHDRGRRAGRAPPAVNEVSEGPRDGASAGSAGLRVTTEAPPDWDARAVHVPGGHVYQSAAWAAYRATQGRDARFVDLGDGVALVSLRRSSGLPGVEAVVRRGPAHGGLPAGRLAERAAVLASWARGIGARDLFLDPERDADPAYEAAMDAAGFTVATELEPSIHVMRLDLAGATLDTLWDGLSKSTRQRIRAAEATVTVREDREGARLDSVAGLLRERADVLGIGLQEGTGYLRGWRALMDAGLARLLVAEHDDELVGGLFIHRPRRHPRDRVLGRPRRSPARPPGRDASRPLDGDPRCARRGRDRDRARRRRPAGSPRAAEAGRPDVGALRAQALVRRALGRALARPPDRPAAVARAARAGPTRRRRCPAPGGKMSAMTSTEHDTAADETPQRTTTERPSLDRLRTDDASWDAFVEASDTPFPLQLTAWATAKAATGWTSERVVVDAGSGPIGGQVLIRTLGPGPLAFGYAPRGPVATRFDARERGRVHRCAPGPRPASSPRPRHRRPRARGPGAGSPPHRVRLARERPRAAGNDPAHRPCA